MHIDMGKEFWSGMNERDKYDDAIGAELGKKLIRDPRVEMQNNRVKSEGWKGRVGQASGFCMMGKRHPYTQHVCERTVKYSLAGYQLTARWIIHWIARLSLRSIRSQHGRETRFLIYIPASKSSRETSQSSAETRFLKRDRPRGPPGTGNEKCIRSFQTKDAFAGPLYTHSHSWPNRFIKNFHVYHNSSILRYFDQKLENLIHKNSFLRLLSGNILQFIAKI